MELTRYTSTAAELEGQPAVVSRNKKTAKHVTVLAHHAMMVHLTEGLKISTDNRSPLLAIVSREACLLLNWFFVNHLCGWWRQAQHVANPDSFKAGRAFTLTLSASKCTQNLFVTRNPLPSQTVPVAMTSNGVTPFVSVLPINPATVCREI